MEKGRLKLKKAVKSSKFDVVFHANTGMDYFVDADGRILMEHHYHANVYMQAEPDNIKEKYMVHYE
jgi:hypothetical protein